MMAPIAPFYADRLYLDLGGETSVHLAKFPTYDETLIDKNLEECMQLAQQISSMTLALRRKAEKKVRQPLTKAVVPAMDEKTFHQIQYIADLVKAEVNIKELEVIPADADMDNLVKRIKANFKTLGSRYGKLMKDVAQAIASFSKEQISEIERKGAYSFTLPSGDPVDLTLEDVEIVTEDMPGWLVANEGKLTVALDITLTDALVKEGIARELVNRIQNIRKSSGYDITDRILVAVEKRDEINAAVEEFGAYIATQVLADSVTLQNSLPDALELDFDEYVVKIKVEKIG